KESQQDQPLSGIEVLPRERERLETRPCRFAHAAIVVRDQDVPPDQPSCGGETEEEYLQAGHAGERLEHFGRIALVAHATPSSNRPLSGRQLRTLGQDGPLVCRAAPTACWASARSHL